MHAGFHAGFLAWDEGKSTSVATLMYGREEGSVRFIILMPMYGNVS